MPVRFRIRSSGGGEYLVDFVDRLGHRRARPFENRKAAETFLEKAVSSRNVQRSPVEQNRVEDAA